MSFRAPFGPVIVVVALALLAGDAGATRPGVRLSGRDSRGVVATKRRARRIRPMIASEVAAALLSARPQRRARPERRQAAGPPVSRAPLRRQARFGERVRAVLPPLLRDVTAYGIGLAIGMVVAEVVVGPGAAKTIAPLVPAVLTAFTLPGAIRDWRASRFAHTDR